MFTGIVEELGEVLDLAPSGDGGRLRVRGPLVTAGVRHGASIAVNGVCLTVADVHAEGFIADVMPETLARSTLGCLRPGHRVNLERALPAGARLDGHIVAGHVDGTGTLLQRQAADRWEVVRIELPEPLGRYVAEKGSIAVDGVSLTVTGVAAGWFTVALIPTTAEVTTLGELAEGERVNPEVDVPAKYVERLLQASGRLS